MALIELKDDTLRPEIRQYSIHGYIENGNTNAVRDLISNTLKETLKRKKLKPIEDTFYWNKQYDIDEDKEVLLVFAYTIEFG